MVRHVISHIIVFMFCFQIVYADSGGNTALELSVQLFDLQGPPGCTDVFLSPDGKIAYFVDQWVTVLDITTRKILRVFSTLQQTSKSTGGSTGGAHSRSMIYCQIQDSCLIDSGNIIAVIDTDMLNLWDTRTGKLKKSIHVTTSVVLKKWQ